MTAAHIRVTRTARTDAWAAAIDAGADVGAARAANAIAEQVAASLATRTTPWGEAFAAPKPSTIRIEAWKRARGLAPPELAIVVEPGNNGATVRLSGPQAGAMQFGNPRNRVFGRGVGPIAPRPILPLRRGTVDLPPDLRDRVLAALRSGFTEAIAR